MHNRMGLEFVKRLPELSGGATVPDRPRRIRGVLRYRSIQEVEICA